MRHLIHLIVAAVTSISPAAVAYAGTCNHAYVAEGQAPPAFAGVTTAESGFQYTLWGWGAYPTQHGSAGAVLLDAAGGVAVAGLLWANAGTCTGQVTGTAVMVEATTEASGGKVAVIALDGAEVQLDEVQTALGGAQSLAGTIPPPTVLGLVSGSDEYGAFVDASLAWLAPPATTWALSNLPNVHVGYGVWATTGAPVDTGERTAFTRVGGTPGLAPYVIGDADGLLPATAAGCTVRVRPSEVSYLALSLIFDGSAVVGGDPADPSAVETHMVSACSQAVDTTAGIIFADGFESGASSAWSATMP